jgi:hypothetical protein
MRKMRREVRGAPVLWAGWLENEMPEVQRAKPAQANNRLFHLGIRQFDRKRAGLLRAEEGRLRVNHGGLGEVANMQNIVISKLPSENFKTYCIAVKSVLL